MQARALGAASSAAAGMAPGPLPSKPAVAISSATFTSCPAHPLLGSAGNPRPSTALGAFPSESSGPSTGPNSRQGGNAFPSGDPWAKPGSKYRISKEEAEYRRQARAAEKAREVAERKQGRCYGCGCLLQASDPLGLGFVNADKYEAKKKHKQLNQLLCERCNELCNGAMIPGVADFAQKLAARRVVVGEAPFGADAAGADTSSSSSSSGGAAGTRASTATLESVTGVGGVGGGAEGGSGRPVTLQGKALISPEALREQITEVGSRAAVVVLLVDLLDVSGSLMSKVRDMVGRNPMVLVGTKLDLLPPGCKPKDVAMWLGDAAASKKLSVTSVHLVSSHTGEGISAVVSKICRERKSRDVYVVGAANVGKSAFVRAMLREMSRHEGGNFDAGALSHGKYLPVESAMPGTTLGLIPLQAFASGGTLYDTPGLHLHHRIPHMLTPSELKLFHPRKRLDALVPASPALLAADAAARMALMGGADISDAEVGEEEEWGEDGEDDDWVDEEPLDLLEDAGDEEADASTAAASAQAAKDAVMMRLYGSGEVKKGRGGLKIVDYEHPEFLEMGEYSIGPAKPAGASSSPSSSSGGSASVSGAPKGKNTKGSAGGGTDRFKDAWGPNGQASAKAGGGASLAVPMSATYMWSDLVRVDVLNAPSEDVRVVFYGPNTMRVAALPLTSLAVPAPSPETGAVKMPKVDYSSLTREGVPTASAETTSPSDGTGIASDGAAGARGGPRQLLVCTESVALRGGMVPHDLLVRPSAMGTMGGRLGAVADVAFSGLPGWVAVWAPRVKKDISLRVWAPRGVEVFLRPPLPCPPPRYITDGPAAAGGKGSKGQKGQKGGRKGSGFEEDGEEEEDDDDEVSEMLAGLAGSGGTDDDPTNDPAWWEAMAALDDEALEGLIRGTSASATASGAASSGGRRSGAGKAAGGARAGGARGVKSLRVGGARRAAGDEEDEEDYDEDEDEEVVVVSATVADILKRPRLDALAAFEPDEDDDDDIAFFEDAASSEPNQARGRRAGTASSSSSSSSPRSGISRSAKGAAAAAAVAGSRGAADDGPVGDADWDPFGLPAKKATSIKKKAAGAASKAAAAGDGDGVDDDENEEVDGEEEEDEPKRRVGVAGAVRRRPAMGAAKRPMLGRRRAAVVVKEDE